MNALAAPNPFVGPRSFTEKDASRFFGRERELEELIRLVIAERIVLLYSPSGAGKTSLLQAGLIPALGDEGFRVLPLIRVNEPPPDISSNGSPNRFVLSALHYLEEGLPEGERLGLDVARPGEITFKQYLDRAPRPPGSEYDVLIFDQFEEILTIDPASRAARKERIAFFEQVADALCDHHRWAVFTLREDYLAGLDPYRRPVPTRLANHFRIDLLRREDARRAISQPSQAARSSTEGDASAPLKPVTFEDDAVTLLLSDLGSSPGQDDTAGGGNTDDTLYVEPLHLQVVCDRLWTQLNPTPGSIITADQIKRSGGVDTALRGYYDEHVAQIAATLAGSNEQVKAFAARHAVTDEQVAVIAAELASTGPQARNGAGTRSAADEAVRNLIARRARAYERNIRDWFQHKLIIGAGIRGQVAQGLTQSEGLDNAFVANLVTAKLVNRETRLKAPWYELAHDRLIRPVRASNAAWSATCLNPTQRAADIWNRASEPGTGLLGVRGWLSAKRWASQPDVQIRPYETRFIDQSGVALRRRALLFILPVALLIVIAVVFLGAIQSRRDERANAITITSGWAGRALSLLPLETGEQDQLDLGLLLAVEAVAYLDQEDIPLTFDTRRGLFNGLVARPYFGAPLSIQETPIALRTRDAPLVISGDGRTLATTDVNGQVVLADVPAQLGGEPAEAPSVLPQSPDQGSGSASTLAFWAADDPGTALLAVGYADGGIGIWDVTDRHSPVDLGPLHRPDADPDCDAAGTPCDRVASLVFGQDSLLAAGYADGAIDIWDMNDAASPRFLKTLLRPDAVTDCVVGPTRSLNECVRGTRLEFGQDGLLAAGYADGALWYWQDSREQQEATMVDLQSATTTVEALAISPDGQFLVFGGQGGFFLHRLGQDQAPRRLDTEHVTGLAFNPQDTTALFSSHATGEILQWELSQLGSSVPVVEGPVTVSEAAGQSVVELAFVPDGRWLISRAADRTFALWNPLGLPPIGVPVSGWMPAHATCVASLTFDAEANTLVSAGDDNQEEVWDLDRIPVTPVPTAPVATPSSLMPSGGEQLAPNLPVQPDVPGASTPGSGGADSGSCQQGDRQTQSEIDSPGLDSGAMQIRIVSPDGTFMAAGYEYGLIVLWEDIDGEWIELGQLPGHSGAVTALSFHPDGETLASGDANGLVVVWNLDVDAWIDDACARAGRFLTDQEVETYLIQEPEEWEPACQRQPADGSRNDGAINRRRNA